MPALGSGRSPTREAPVIDGADERLEWTEGVADHARTVVVPLANPDTAIDLLRIARGLLPDAGGRLLAIVVVTDDADAEKSRDVSEGMQALIDTMADRLTGATVTFRTRTATSVARGILDSIRDSGADSVVLGIRAPSEDDEQTRLGAVVESVVDAAACDVVIHRPGAEGGLDDVERLLVAVDGRTPSRNAVRVATLLRRGLQVDLDLVHAHVSEVPASRGEAVVARSMADLVTEREVGTQVVEADDPVAAIAGEVREGDLLVLGFGHEERASSLEIGSVGRALLDEVDGPVLTVARVQVSRSTVHERLRRVAAWLHPRLTDVEQDSMRSHGESAAEPTLDYVAMTAVSGIIASFGLLLDSAAVIIGAMLVAPLMNPLQAFGIGVVAGRATVAMRALWTIALGSVLVFVVAAVSGLLVGVAAPTAEMASRGSPSLLDAAVALAAGVAGAYATARKDIPAALAGVAIAAALVPPICAAGLALAAGRYGLAGGASLLFLVNIVCIAVVSAVVFQWLGLRPRDRTRTERGQKALAVGTVATLVVLLAALVVVGARKVRVDERPLEAVVAEASADAALAEVAVVSGGPPVRVRVIVDLAEGADAELPQRLARELRRALEQQVGEPVDTRLVVREVVAID